MPTARYDAATGELPPELATALSSIASASGHEREHLAVARAHAARLRAAVQDARQAGASWTLIARAAGISRGGAEKRFGRDRLF